MGIQKLIYVNSINYYAYADLSFPVIWKLMPHTLLYILLLGIITCSILLFIVIKKTRQTLTLEKVSKPKFIAESITIENGALIGGRITIEPRKQVYTILRMFFDGDYRISKEELKRKLWAKHQTDTTSNMTSAINRVNEDLNKAQCGWITVTDPEDDKYYILKKDI